MIAVNNKDFGFNLLLAFHDFRIIDGITYAGAVIAQESAVERIHNDRGIHIIAVDGDAADLMIRQENDSRVRKRRDMVFVAETSDSSTDGLSNNAVALDFSFPFVGQQKWQSDLIYEKLIKFIYPLNGDAE